MQTNKCVDRSTHYKHAVNGVVTSSLHAYRCSMQYCVRNSLYNNTILPILSMNNNIDVHSLWDTFLSCEGSPN